MSTFDHDAGYDLADPKHPTFAERMADRADTERKREKEEGRPRRPVYRLVLGPQHGKVAEAGVASGVGVAMLLSDPRDEAFLDEIAGELHWNAKTEWYEARK